jgi:hypothetical protein
LAYIKALQKALSKCPKNNRFFIALLSNLLNEMNHKEEFSLFIGCSRIAHLFKIDSISNFKT